MDLFSRTRSGLVWEVAASFWSLASFSPSNWPSTTDGWTRRTSLKSESEQTFVFFVFIWTEMLLFAPKNLFLWRYSKQNWSLICFALSVVADSPHVLSYLFLLLLLLPMACDTVMFFALHALYFFSRYGKLQIPSHHQRPTIISNHKSVSLLSMEFPFTLQRRICLFSVWIASLFLL